MRGVQLRIKTIKYEPRGGNGMVVIALNVLQTRGKRSETGSKNLIVSLYCNITETNEYRYNSIFSSIENSK